MKEELLTIKEFAVLCRTTARTIRFYDLEGLLKPEYIDPKTHYRYYSPVQAREFFKIRLLQEFQLPLTEIQTILPSATERTFLQKQLAKVKEEIEEKQREYRFLTQIKSFLFSGSNAQTHLVPETIGPFVLLCMYVPDGRYDRITTDILHLMEVACTHKIPITDTQMYFYLDTLEYLPKRERLEIALVTKLKQIPKKQPHSFSSDPQTRNEAQRTYYFKVFPQTRVHAYTYKGPFEYITLVYQKILKEVRPDALSFDMHLAGPWNRTSPYDFVTKIAFPQSSSDISIKRLLRSSQ